MNRVPRRYFKTLEAGGVCPISGLVFPLPDADRAGGWVEQGGPLDPDGLGFLVCPIEQLAAFACAELYEVELDGSHETGGDALIARRMRLLRRHGEWPGLARELCNECLARARALPPSSPRLAEYVADVAACVDLGFVPGVLFVSAKAHACAADPEGRDSGVQAAAFLRERDLQSAWIAARLMRPALTP